jgi:hypothetical protein
MGRQGFVPKKARLEKVGQRRAARSSSERGKWIQLISSPGNGLAMPPALARATLLEADRAYIRSSANRRRV